MRGRGWWVVAVGLGIMVSVAVTAGAQTARAAKDAAVKARIIDNLEQSLDLQRKALAELGDSTTAVPLVYQSYVKLRAAHSKLEIHLRNQNEPDPLQVRASPRLNDARMHVLRAQTALKNPGSVPKGRSVQVAEEQLTKAMALVQGVLATGL